MSVEAAQVVLFAGIGLAGLGAVCMVLKVVFSVTAWVLESFRISK